MSVEGSGRYEIIGRYYYKCGGNLVAVTGTFLYMGSMI